MAGQAWLARFQKIAPTSSKEAAAQTSVTPEEKLIARTMK
jgi:hypothetical protein